MASLALEMYCNYIMVMASLVMSHWYDHKYVYIGYLWGESLIRTFSLFCYCIVLPHEITSFRLLMGNHHQELSTAALSFLLQFIF